MRLLYLHYEISIYLSILSKNQPGKTVGFYSSRIKKIFMITSIPGVFHVMLFKKNLTQFQILRCYFKRHSWKPLIFSSFMELAEICCIRMVVLIHSTLKFVVSNNGAEYKACARASVKCRPLIGRITRARAPSQISTKSQSIPIIVVTVKKTHDKKNCSS